LGKKLIFNLTDIVQIDYLGYARSWLSCNPLFSSGECCMVGLNDRWLWRKMERQSSCWIFVSRKL